MLLKIRPWNNSNIVKKQVFLKDLCFSKQTANKHVFLFPAYHERKQDLKNHTLPNFKILFFIKMWKLHPLDNYIFIQVNFGAVVLKTKQSWLFLLSKSFFVKKIVKSTWRKWNSEKFFSLPVMGLKIFFLDPGLPFFVLIFFVIFFLP